MTSKNSKSQSNPPSVHHARSVLDKEVKICTGDSVRSNKVRVQTMTFAEFRAQKFNEFEYGPKEGSYLMSSVCAGGQRGDQNATETPVVLLDVDNGYPIDKARHLLDTSGYITILWTTHSHDQITDTDIDPKDLEKFVDNDTTGKLAEQSQEEQVRQFLIKVKGYHPAVVASGVKVEELAKVEQRRDGSFATTILRVMHNPIQKFRILFVLEDPLRPSPQDGKAALANYKRAYRDLVRGLAHEVGITGYDPASEKLTQPMYLPRVRDAETEQKYGHTLEVINEGHGRAVNANLIEPPPEPENKLRDGADRARTDLLDDVPVLYGEAAFYGMGLLSRFRAAEWLEESCQCAGLEERKDYDPETGKISTACPLEDGHSPMEGEDVGFFAIDANKTDVGAGVIGCRHNHCHGIRPSGFIRIIQNLSGEDSVVGLLDYCDISAADRQFIEAEIAAEKRIAQDPLLKDAIEALDKEPPSADVAPILRAISLIAKQSDRDRASKALAKAIGSTVKGVRDDVSELNNERRSRCRSRSEACGNVPVIETALGFDDLTATVTSALLSSNAQNPRLFRTADGDTARINRTSSGAKLELINTQAKWMNALSERVLFENSDGHRVPPPTAVVQYMHGASGLALPEIDGIVTVPIFAPDGRLRVEAGYDPELKVYLSPVGHYIPVPDVVTDADLQNAKARLLEILWDIPFSDDFDGEHPLKQYLDAVDDSGHRLPNLERGASSRANFIALLLQPFMQALISGNVPIYVITKPKMGTGASLLAGVAYTIQTGAPFTVRSVADNIPEFEKQLLAALASGDATVIFDNIKITIHSPNLEAALTSGVFKGRILGKTDEVSVSMKQKTIALTGNNLETSDELRRRMVPSYLDAATPNPATDRQADTFKHPKLEGYCKDHRAELVWACHVLIRSWIQNDRPPGTASMASFESYASVMSGVLDNAGIAGFLDNRTSYMDTESVEQDLNTDFIQAWWDEFKITKVTMDELLGIATSMNNYGTLRPKFELPLKGESEDGFKKSLGKYIDGPLRNQTFHITASDETRQIVRAKKVPNAHPVKRYLEVVGE